MPNPDESPSTDVEAFAASGHVTIHDPVYYCPRHGDVMHVQTMWKDGRAVRSWCGECYLEMLDAHCQVVTQIGTKPSA